MTDLKLLEQFANNRDDDAFAELVRHHISWVNSTARRLVGDPSLADDVTQAVFVLLAQKAASLRSEIVLSTWLFTVTRYAANNALRDAARRRRREREVAAMRAEAAESVDDLRWNDVAGVLDGLVAQLRSSDRRAVLLRFYEQKSFVEIGSALAISEEAARKRVSRAVEQLRGLFARRGVATSTAALSTAMFVNINSPASAAFVAASTGAALSSASAGSVPVILKGVGMSMTWATLKPAIALVLSLIVVFATTAIALQLTVREPAAMAPPSAPAPATNPTLLRGRVIGPDDAPIANAKVILIRSQDFDRVIGERTTTDANGRFQLQGTDDAMVELVVAANGFGMVSSRTQGAKFGGSVVLQLRPATQLRVRLLGPDGNAAAGVRVGPRTITHPMRSTGNFDSAGSLPKALIEELAQSSGPDGVVALPDMPQGWKTLLEVLDDRFVRFDPTTEIILGDKPTTEPRPMQLQAAIGISGRIIFQDTGRPAAEVVVGAHQSTINRTASNIGGIYVKSDADGRYSFTRLPAGEYFVALNTRGELEKRYTAVAQSMTLAAGQNATDRNFAFIPGGTITGKVVLAGTGEPMVDAHVAVYGPAHPREGRWISTVITGKDGSFIARVPPGRNELGMSGMRAGTAPVRPYPTVEVEDGKSVQVETIELDMRNVEVSNFQPITDGRMVDGNVEDGDGRPVEGAIVLMEPVPTAPAGRRGGAAEFANVSIPRAAARTDQNGNFTIPKVPAGMQLSATRGDTGSIAPVVLGDGQTHVALMIRKEVSSVGIVEIQIQDEQGRPIPNATVALSKVMATGTSLSGAATITTTVLENQTTGPDGKTTHRSVANDGQYMVGVRAPGYARGQSSFQGAQPLVTITLRKADSFVAGVVHDVAGKPVAGITVVSSNMATGTQEVQTDEQGRFRIEGLVADAGIGVWTLDGTTALRAVTIRAGTDNAVLIHDPTNVDARRGRGRGAIQTIPGGAR